jgi:hypothetical protein
VVHALDRHALDGSGTTAPARASLGWDAARRATDVAELDGGLPGRRRGVR